MKYIDAEKLIALIDAKLEDLGMSGSVWVGRSVLNELKEDIESLQQEQEQYVIGGQVFGATDIEQLYKGKVYIVSNLVQDTEFGIEPREKVKMLLIKD